MAGARAEKAFGLLEAVFTWGIATMRSKLTAIQVTLSQEQPYDCGTENTLADPSPPPPFPGGWSSFGVADAIPPASGLQGACASPLPRSQGDGVRLRPSGSAAGPPHGNFSTPGADSARLHLRPEPGRPEPSLGSRRSSSRSRVPTTSLPAPALLALPVFTPLFHS